MNPLLALGVFLLGAAIGAWLTAIRYSGHMQKLIAELNTVLADYKHRPTTDHANWPMPNNARH